MSSVSRNVFFGNASPARTATSSATPSSVAAMFFPPPPNNTNSSNNATPAVTAQMVTTTLPPPPPPSPPSSSAFIESQLSACDCVLISNGHLLRGDAAWEHLTERIAHAKRRRGGSPASKNPRPTTTAAAVAASASASASANATTTSTSGVSGSTNAITAVSSPADAAIALESSTTTTAAATTPKTEQSTEEEGNRLLNTLHSFLLSVHASSASPAVEKEEELAAMLNSFAASSSSLSSSSSSSFHQPQFVPTSADVTRATRDAFQQMSEHKKQDFKCCIDQTYYQAQQEWHLRQQQDVETSLQLVVTGSQNIEKPKVLDANSSRIAKMNKIKQKQHHMTLKQRAKWLSDTAKNNGAATTRTIPPVVANSLPDTVSLCEDMPIFVLAGSQLVPVVAAEIVDDNNTNTSTSSSVITTKVPHFATVRTLTNSISFDDVVSLLLQNKSCRADVAKEESNEEEQQQQEEEEEAENEDQERRQAREAMLLDFLSRSDGHLPIIELEAVSSSGAVGWRPDATASSRYVLLPRFSSWSTTTTTTMTTNQKQHRSTRADEPTTVQACFLPAFSGVAVATGFSIGSEKDILSLRMATRRLFQQQQQQQQQQPRPNDVLTLPSSSSSSSFWSTRTVSDLYRALHHLRDAVFAFERSSVDVVSSSASSSSTTMTPSSSSSSSKEGSTMMMVTLPELPREQCEVVFRTAAASLISSVKKDLMLYQQKSFSSSSSSSSSSSTTAASTTTHEDDGGQDEQNIFRSWIARFVKDAAAQGEEHHHDHHEQQTSADKTTKSAEKTLKVAAPASRSEKDESSDNHQNSKQEDEEDMMCDMASWRRATSEIFDAPPPKKSALRSSSSSLSASPTSSVTASFPVAAAVAADDDGQLSATTASDSINTKPRRVRFAEETEGDAARGGRPGARRLQQKRGKTESRFFFFSTPSPSTAVMAVAGLAVAGVLTATFLQFLRGSGGAGKK